MDTPFVTNCEQKDCVKTPDYILQYVQREFGDYFDPCPLKPAVDGLKLNWPSDRVIFVNPPFSQTPKWIKKAHLEWQKGKHVVCLIKTTNSMMSTNWFHSFVLQKAKIRCFDHRIKFEGFKFPARFACVLLEYKPHTSKNCVIPALVSADEIQVE